MTPVFADTWAWLALFNKNDSHHRKAVRVWRELLHQKRSVLTSEFVWIETMNAMAAAPLRSAVIRGKDAVLRSPAVSTVPFQTSQLERAHELFRGRADKSWSLTDCRSFVIMEDLGMGEALTGDRHFEQAGFRFLL